MVCGPGDAAAPTGDRDQAGRSGRAQFPASLLRDLTGRSAPVFLGWLARPEAVQFSTTRRDMDHLVITIRIGLPSHDGTLRDKDVYPEPCDEIEAHSLRTVHFIPGDLHPVRLVIRRHRGIMASGSELTIKSPIRVVHSIRVAAEGVPEPRLTE
jgi:hypothetical protein